METVKRKINALKDEIERKDEGKINLTLILMSLTPIPFIPITLYPKSHSPQFCPLAPTYLFISRYHSPPRKVKERTNGKGKI